MSARPRRKAAPPFAACLLAALSVASATAMVPITEDLASSLDSVQVGRVLRLDAFPLDDGTTLPLELERFEVWAPGAAVVERGHAGERNFAPPSTRYFRGHVAGDPDSWVFLARDESVRGFITTGGRLFAIAPPDDAYRAARPGTDALVRQIDREADSPLDRPMFRCDNDGLDLIPADGLPIARAHESLLAHSMSNGKTYQATIAIDTDYELYQHFGSTVALAAYVSDLVAASSAIYYRDVQTVITLGNLYTYSTASDPWTATSTFPAMVELGDYWHTHRAAVPRTTVHLLSKKSMGGGISWVGVLCASDLAFLWDIGTGSISFPCDPQNETCHWAGGYGVSASLIGQFSTANPSLYWDILCFTHELGHNFDADHTECYVPPVDTCTPCSAFSCTGTVPPGGGTIMSYCHACLGGYNNITLYFGFSGQASQVVLDAMRSHIESRAAVSPSCIPEILQLTANKNGTGAGTVTSSPTGIDCGATCSALFAKDSSVTLTATAAVGSTFAGWSGACTGNGSCLVTMSAARSVTATFDLLPSYLLTVSKNGAGSGTVSSSPAGITCGVDCSEAFTSGTAVVLTATPAILSAFTGWTGACTGTGSCQVTMDGARAVGAGFADVSGCTTTVSNQTITTAVTVEDCHGIYAGPGLVVAPAGQLTLRAAAQVVMRNGTSIAGGGRLTVALDPSLAGT